MPTAAGDVRSPDPATTIISGSQTITIAPNAIAVAGTTLKPGDSAIKIAGTPISLGSSAFVIGGRTKTLGPWLSEAATTAPESYLTTVGGKTITMPPETNAIIIDSITLHRTDPATTIDGTYISLCESMLVVGTETTPITLSTPTMTPAPYYIIIGSTIITVASKSVVVDGTTVHPSDPSIIVDGTSVSLGLSVLIVGTRTMCFPLSDVTTASAEGVGAMIMYGFGGAEVGKVVSSTPAQTAGGGGIWSGGGNGTGNGTVVFTGGASRGIGWAALAWTLGIFAFQWIFEVH